MRGPEWGGRRLALLMLSVFASAFASGQPLMADRDAILKGVQSIAAPGVPGPLVLLGDQTLALVTGTESGVPIPVAAAGRSGAGRIVAFGHTGYAGAPEGGDTRAMLANAARWAARGGGKQTGPKRMLVLSGEWAKGLEAIGITAQPKTDEWLAQLGEIDLLCVSHGELSDAEIESVQRYVRDGGGLLAAGLGWGWLQLNPGKSLSAHPLNRLVGDAGILWADGTLEHTTRDGYAVRPPPELCHASAALSFLIDHSEGNRTARREDIRQATFAATLAARTVPPADQFLRPKLRELLAGRARELVPTEKKPITLLDALPRLLLALQVDEISTLPTEAVAAHPAAAEFPGQPPTDAAPVSRSVRIDPKIPGLHSTGLYAAAGRAITIELPKAAQNGGLRLRIGAHSDELWHLDAWKRVPEVTLERKLDTGVTTIASPFGGPVYIVTPENCRLEPFEVAIRGAFEMPHYVHGQTDLTAWRESIRQRPAPWAELESKKIILTVPSRVVRELDRPDEVMNFWDELSDAHATLATIPLERPRPERFVADIQISAGYMHSGYPIMTHLDVAEHFVDVARLRSGDGWGFFHELGHNHQVGDWTFEGTGEVTCNLFALHAIDTICKPKPGYRGHDAVDKPPDVTRYMADGAKFEEWKRDPFLALQMYIQLQRQFGWPPFKKVFAEYRALRKEDRPKSEDEKRDQWMVRFSRTVGRNLGPFFERWGVPTSDAARKSISDLPKWMPDDLADTK